MAEGVPTNNQRGRRSGPCRLWGGLDKARHIVPTALLVRVQCFRKSLHKAVQGPSTRPIVVSMINGSYCRRRRRLTIFEPDEMKFGVSLKVVYILLVVSSNWIQKWTQGCSAANLIYRRLGFTRGHIKYISTCNILTEKRNCALEYSW